MRFALWVRDAAVSREDEWVSIEAEEAEEVCLGNLEESWRKNTTCGSGLLIFVFLFSAQCPSSLYRSNWILR
jgi:hypothetical protein